MFHRYNSYFTFSFVYANINQIADITIDLYRVNLDSMRSSGSGSLACASVLS